MLLIILDLVIMETYLSWSSMVLYGEINAMTLIFASRDRVDYYQRSRTSSIPLFECFFDKEFSYSSNTNGTKLQIKVEIAPGIDMITGSLGQRCHNRTCIWIRIEKSFYTYVIGMVELNGDNVEELFYSHHDLSNLIVFMNDNKTIRWFYEDNQVICENSHHWIWIHWSMVQILEIYEDYQLKQSNNSS